MSYQGEESASSVDSSLMMTAFSSLNCSSSACTEGLSYEDLKINSDMGLGVCQLKDWTLSGYSYSPKSEALAKVFAEMVILVSSPKGDDMRAAEVKCELAVPLSV